MAARAPKQWCLSKSETVTSFDSWKENLVYGLSLDPNFAPFLTDGIKWAKKTTAAPLRGFADDGAPIPEASRKTAEQKVTMLELMLGQIANFCPIISRGAIVRNSTSIASVWQVVRAHFGFQKTGARFLDFTDFKLEGDEKPEDLYQRLSAFVEDNLLTQGGGVVHHGDAPKKDEELSPTLENVIVLQWLHLIHEGLPRLVKQRYGTALRSQTLATLKPEISLGLTSLLDELRSSEEIKVMRSASFGTQRDRRTFNPDKKRPASNFPSFRRCPLCQEAGRSDSGHFLSKCKYLPEPDRKFLTKARRVMCEVESDSDTSEFEEHVNQPENSHSVSRVQVKKSPYINAFYQQHGVRITVDSGAETNMIKESLAHLLGVRILKSSQLAIQADGKSPLTVVGETKITLTRGQSHFVLEALVVQNLDVEILGGVPFMEQNDITLRPARHEIGLRNGSVFCYGYSSDRTYSPHSVRRTVVGILRAPPVSTTVWPGEYVEVPIPNGLPLDDDVVIEPRCDVPGDQSWVQPSVVPSIDGKVRVVNMSKEPQVLKRSQHFGQVVPVMDPVEDYSADHVYPKIPVRTTSLAYQAHHEAVKTDPHSILTPNEKSQFMTINERYTSVFSLQQPHVYNGAMGPFEAVVNMGPVLPPQRKGRVPQYSRDKLAELQDKFDELEASGVFARPEDVGVVAEYLSPSFLVKKASGGYRLVTAFSDVGRYAKPQPSLMPDVDSTLRSIAQWEYIIATDLRNAFFQIPLSKPSMKFCGVATPFKGVRVYTKCAMGMPGSETALEEIMCRILGDLLQEGVVAKLADDLYVGASTPHELAQTWDRVLSRLEMCNIGLSPSKTVVCPKSTDILGWVWTQGKLTASPHRLSTLTTCELPKTVKALRSFVGAYKTLSRVLPDCASLVAPLDEVTAGRESTDRLSWTDPQTEAFQRARQHLSNSRSIVLPRTDDQLWIVTDGSVKKHGIGATLYIGRGERLQLSGFFSAKLPKRQNTWLPCEIEALSIASAIKHFSPYLIQSSKKACILTDSKPCVQAYGKLCRGEFSASPRITTFLSAVSRYQASVRHLAGAANVPSDFSSRNAPDCTDSGCQVCSFVNQALFVSVGAVTVEDITSGRSTVPFASRSAWLKTQSECSDLRRAHGHLTQGTRPSKKATNIKDVKRYLNACTIARDGLLVACNDEPFRQSRECIVIPRQVLSGLLTALHIRLAHPSAHQLKLVFRRRYFALDFDKAAMKVTEACAHCAALRHVPTSLSSQSTTDPPPTTIGVSFAADVLRRDKQNIFVFRETVTSYTVTMLVESERGEHLSQAIILAATGLVPLAGPTAVVRCDPAPGFCTLRASKILMERHLRVEIGDAKNKNKNPVAEKAVQEIEEELRKLQPEGGTISPATLAIATASLNSRIRSRGLSAREMLTQRDQFTGGQLPVNDRELIELQNNARLSNHTSSASSKAPRAKIASQHSPSVGDLVHLSQDGDKSHARDRYLVTSIQGQFGFVRKFTGLQFRANEYRVRLSDCYIVPNAPESRARVQSSDEDESDTEMPIPPPLPTVPGEIACIPGQAAPPPTQEPAAPPLRRSTRTRTIPRRFSDFVMD